jgi:2-oxoglutarate ferredoxin oxidoreductase subunit alpha
MLGLPPTLVARQHVSFNLEEDAMSATDSTKPAVDDAAARSAAGEKEYVQVHSSTVRFAGDSGDGMQVVGSQFADIASITGLAVCTQPDYPSEIRAPAGSLGGVSGFQLSFADHEVHTPGDSPYVLVAMNPAALKVNLREVQPGGILIVNEDEFNEANLTKAGYAANPLVTGELSAYRVVPVAMTRMNEEAVRHLNLPRKDAARCKNFFALGLSLWLYDRPIQPVLEFLIKKFRKNLPVMAANGASLRAGYNFADTAELFRVQHTVAPARLPKGRYRRLTGNEAAALGLVAAAHKAGRTLVYASYPITPASEILHELSKYKDFDVRTLQVEDEIAACVAAIGASFAGAIGVTGTSGPGLALKTEGLGLAVMTELPMVVIDVQRAGPSTGMPTKTEQSDLLMAMHGRHGEAPLAVLAAATPADCFAMVFEAVRLATKYMTPVMVLSDSFLANGAEPWRVVEPEELPDLHTPEIPTMEEFAPYRRNPETLARPWVSPGTPGYEHRIGGLEKTDVTGAVSYDAANHQRMTELRAEKIERIARDIPPAKVTGTGTAALLVVSWGSTFGSVAAAASSLREAGRAVDHLHLRYLNPFPANLGEILKEYQRILVPENNMGQLCMLLRAKYLVDARSLPKVEGRPFRVSELVEEIGNILKETEPIMGWD